jgi:uncharacterized Zn finger protein
MEKIEQNLTNSLEKETDNLQKYLQKYLNFNDIEMKRVKMIDLKNLPESYKKQLEGFNDKRLEEIRLAIVPDFWKTSESHADQQFIIFNQKYFEDETKADKIHWLTHELAHCQKFLDSPETYFKEIETPAFGNIPSENFYPNNKVEEYAFTQQFQTVKGAGITKEEMLNLLKEKYKDENDFLFFNRLLDKIYKQ